MIAYDVCRNLIAAVHIGLSQIDRIVRSVTWLKFTEPPIAC
jgi:hypothetical protein